MAAIATKFALWEVPALDTLKDAKAYILRQKVNNKEKLSREEKNWISYQVNHNTYFKSGIPVYEKICICSAFCLGCLHGISTDT